MTMRTFLSTLAILAGLAAAPGAQPFVWEAGGANGWDDRVSARIEVVVDRLAQSFAQLADRFSQQVEATADRAAARVERHTERIRERVDAHLARHLGTGAPYSGDSAAQNIDND